MLTERSINFCKNAEFFSFCALIFFLPIAIAFSEVFATFTLVFFFVKRGTIFISFLRENLRTKVISRHARLKDAFLAFLRIVKPVKSPLNGPLGFFVLVCGVSIFFSQYPILSIKGFFFKVLQGIYLYFVFIEFIKEKRQIKIFINVFFASMAVVFFNGLFQYFLGKDFIFGGAYADRLYSCLRHANDFGAYLILTCPLILSIIFLENFNVNSKNIKGAIFKILLGVLFAAGYFCLGMTLSRGAWIGFSAALIFLGIIFWNKKKMILFISFFIVIIFFLFFSKNLHQVRNATLISDDFNGEQIAFNEAFSGGSPSLSKIYNFSKEIFYKIKNFGGSGRTRYWEKAISIIKQSPVIGNGLNTYSVVAAKNPVGGGGYPHNCYLQMAAEIGIVGLGAFFWVLFVLFRSSLKNISKMKDDFLFCVLIGLLAGLFGFLIHAGVDTILYSVQLGNLMWVAMGVIVAAQQIDFAIRKS